MSNQQEYRPLQSGLPSILLMQETVFARLNDALPSQLTSMAIVQRVVSGSMIKSKLRAILGDADSTANDRLGFGSFPNIMGLDCLERTARAGSRDKFRIQTHFPRKASQQEIQSKDMKERDKEPDWADDTIWLQFLSSVIVRLWLLHLDTLTAKECRDEYLLAARSCSGYGICKFYAARAKMSILTLETVNDTLQSSGSLEKGKNREDNTSIRRRSSSIHQDDLNHDARCVPIERLYACNTSSKEMNGSITSTIALQLSIDADGISLIERKRLIETMVENSDSVNSRWRNNSIELGDEVNGDPLELSCKKDLVLTYLLLSIKIDDIISWGYSDVELIIHFKQREGNHEDSYYSNDDEEEDNPSLQVC